METSWALHVGDVQVSFGKLSSILGQCCDIDFELMQVGEGYPGWEQCNPVIPHAKW